MPRIAYVNGAYVPHDEGFVHIEDRGFQLADGVYEVMAYIHGTLADERGHLDRLERSLAELRIAMPLPRRTLQFIIRETLRRNRLKNANVYIQITRGAAKRDFVFPAKDTSPTLVITTRPYNFDDNPRLKTGIKAISLPDLRWKRPDIKSVSLLPQVLARQQAAEQGAQEAWLLDDKGFVTEGAASNAWIVTAAGKLVTRQAAGNTILRGVTRTALQSLGLEIEERPFALDEVHAAREAFTSSAVALLMPVVMMDGRPIGDGKPGPVTLKLYEDYLSYVKQAKEKQIAWTA